MDSLSTGRYAVATSGGRTYTYGCMTRVGIAPPAVTITAHDKHLKAGIPIPPRRRCVVFDNLLSGIRAGVASGATVIAPCISHARERRDQWRALDCGRVL
ncbi:hypothetical protein C8Q76DRAFT_765597 [Earliella scabrosa]|nr:hypothetical protein C8Q76DRAFT_765597 [Earliella scabrosa]